MRNAQNCVVFYSPFSCYCFLVTNRTTGNVSFEINSTHSRDSTGGSIFLKHTDVRMTRTKVRGGLNLSESVCNQFTMISVRPINLSLSSGPSTDHDLLERTGIMFLQAPSFTTIWTLAI